MFIFARNLDLLSKRTASRSKQWLSAAGMQQLLEHRLDETGDWFNLHGSEILRDMILSAQNFSAGTPTIKG